MESEKVIYYYPMQEQREQQNNPFEVIRRRFREEKLILRYYGDVVGCAVPPFYYRKRPWKPQMLSEAMENALRCVEGMTDTWLHPQVAALLTEGYEGRFETRRETVQMVVGQLVRQYAGDVIGACGEVVVLLGTPADTDWQMKMTRELLLPYLPKINKLLIFYEEIAETDIWMELGSHLDEYYYEYGLVPQLEPYITPRGTGMTDTVEELRQKYGEQNETGGQPQEKHNVLKCGKPRCSGMVLDYSAQFRYPKIMPESRAVYIDIVSGAEKEHLLGRKNPWIPYTSPLKYLDTIVKSGYDS